MAWHKAITHQFGTGICDIDLPRQPLKLHLVQIWERKLSTPVLLYKGVERVKTISCSNYLAGSGYTGQQTTLNKCAALIKFLDFLY